MTFRQVADVFDYSKSSGNDRLVLLAIAEHANDEYREAWPSVGEISRKANIDRRTVQRCLRRLVELRELVIAGPVSVELSPHVPERYRPNLYRLTLPTGAAERRPSGAAEPPPRGGTNPGSGAAGVPPRTITRTKEPVVRTKSVVPRPFTISEAMWDWLDEKHLNIDVELETENFLDHYTAKDEKRVDWEASWRTWMRNASKFQKQRQPKSLSA